jgi:1-deoxy-D-xylulose-5-phosphate reductoisomerase
MTDSDSSKKNIAILGSTGSIGTQALEVIGSHPDRFEVYALTANNNVDLLIRQAIEHKPDVVVIANKIYYPKLKEALSGYPIKVYAGDDSISQVVEAGPIDIVLTAMVGYSGLEPTIHAIKAGKTIALANKETMVVAGEIITRLATENNVSILPVDSEHSAIFQCLEYYNPVEKIILTASGGPFRIFSIDELKKVTKEQALRHPNWAMGAKVTIDSASMINKGFEVIEAKWLFNLKPEQIEVMVHPQSIIHSMVQFHDGSVKAQMGLPDMKLPILYALSYPERLKTDFPRIDFSKFSSLTFEKPDLERFRNLALAFRAMEAGGTMPCTLNAANEIVVDAFLHDRIGFPDMSDIIENTMEKTGFKVAPTYEDYVETDTEARIIARSFIFN